jgi:hypothetical protein
MTDQGDMPRHPPLPKDARARLRALMRDGLTPQQAAITLREKLGNPDARWLDQLLAIAQAG